MAAAWPSLSTSTCADDKHWNALLMQWPAVEERDLVRVAGNYHVDTIPESQGHERSTDESHWFVVHSKDFPISRGSPQSSLQPCFLLLQQPHKPLLANFLVDHEFMLTIFVFTKVLGANATMPSIVGILHVGIHHEKLDTESFQIEQLAVVRGWHLPAGIIKQVLNGVIELCSDV